MSSELEDSTGVRHPSEEDSTGVTQQSEEDSTGVTQAREEDSTGVTQPSDRRLHRSHAPKKPDDSTGVKAQRLLRSQSAKDFREVKRLKTPQESNAPRLVQIRLYLLTSERQPRSTHSLGTRHHTHGVLEVTRLGI